MVECRPVPQGSMKGAAITRDDGTPGTVFMCDNKRTHVYRREVGFDALRARALLGVHDVFAPAGPLRLNCTFVFKKPRSAPADRARPIVKPDLDKLMRACCDALSGVLWKDDAQVCEATIAKIYGDVECVHISVQMIEN
jgi:Holliday junction resolvase RusA-like endonuclease